MCTEEQRILPKLTYNKVFSIQFKRVRALLRGPTARVVWGYHVSNRHHHTTLKKTL